MISKEEKEKYEKEWESKKSERKNIHYKMQKHIED